MEMSAGGGHGRGYARIGDRAAKQVVRQVEDVVGALPIASLEASPPCPPTGEWHRDCC